MDGGRGGTHFLKPNLKSFCPTRRGKKQINVCQHYPQHKETLSSSSFCPSALYSTILLDLHHSCFSCQMQISLFFFSSLCSGSYRWRRNRQLQRGETAHITFSLLCKCDIVQQLFSACWPLLQTSSPPDSASPCSTFGSSAGSSLCQTHFSAFLFVSMWRTIQLLFRRAKS